jgi:hypothetical protein
MPDGSGDDVRGKGGSHRYPIQPGQGYFDAGTTGDGRQVLMGLYCPDLVAIFFDASGDLISHEARHLEFLRRSSVIVEGEPIEGMVGVYDIYDERIPPRIVAWQEGLEFQPATIRVKRFFLDELGIGIEDYPAHFGETLADPEASDEEKADVRESIRLWDADGQFVLLWGNDYWLDDSGEVVSS